jgi:serine/threonine protein kinase
MGEEHKKGVIELAKREANAMTDVQHPNVVKLIDF